MHTCFASLQFGGLSPEKPRRKAAKRTGSYKELSDTKYFQLLERNLEEEERARKERKAAAKVQLPLPRDTRSSGAALCCLFAAFVLPFAPFAPFSFLIAAAAAA